MQYIDKPELAKPTGVPFSLVPAGSAFTEYPVGDGEISGANNVLFKAQGGHVCFLAPSCDGMHYHAYFDNPNKLCYNVGRFSVVPSLPLE